MGDLPGGASSSKSGDARANDIGWCSVCLKPFTGGRSFQAHLSHSSSCFYGRRLNFNEQMEMKAGRAAAAQLDHTHAQSSHSLAFDAKMSREAGRAETTAFLLRSRGFRRYFSNVPLHHLELEREDLKCLMDIVRKELQEGIRPGMSQQQIDACISRTCNIFNGIETTRKEDVVRARDLAAAGHEPLTPVRRLLVDANGVYTNDTCYDIPVDLSLEKLLVCHPHVWEAVCNSHKQWLRTGCERRNKEITELTDISDGDVFRTHPQLGDDAAFAANAASDHTIRLKLILYYDEVETVNAIGAFTGAHKIGLFYYALVDLPPEQRMALHNIQLACVVLYEDFNYYGAEQIICGPPGEARGVGTSIGAAMERLHDGISVCLPSYHLAEDGAARRMKDWTADARVAIKGWIICLSADYPAAAACCGFKMSTSADRFCRQCMLDQNDTSKYPKPFSFLRLGCPFQLRSMRLHQEQKLKFDRATTSGLKEKLLQQSGVSSFVSPMCRVPYFDHTRMAPQDVMHVLAEGILKMEIAAFLFMLCRNTKWGVTLQSVNDTCISYPWPTGHKPPQFRDVILEGRAKEKGEKGRPRPKKGCHVHGSAGQVLDFTLHSLEVLRPLIRDTEWPPWKCWQLLVQILVHTMQHTVTTAMIWKLDDLIQQHQTIFLSIPEYVDLFKPKHHFCAHLPLDITRFGPPRHFWCMRFEAMNQVFKHIAMGGNYTETCKRCANFFVMRVALTSRHQLHHGIGQTIILTEGALEKHDFAPAIFIWEGEHHTGIVRRFYQVLQLPLDGPIHIQWVNKLANAGHTFTAGHDWLYFNTWERVNAEPMCLVFLFRIAFIGNRFFFVLHNFPCTMNRNSGRDSLPQAHIESKTIPAVAVYPLDMLCLIPIWRIPDGPVGSDLYRLLPRLFA